jgi:hypothetical protein
VLKIGVVRWRGKCSRHPRFDPFTDGAGAIKAGCEKCAALLEIHSCHQRMMTLMRNFTPPAERKMPARPLDDAQASLF